MKFTDLILSNDGNTRTRILLLVAIAWVPLVILSLIEGTLFATDITIPFVNDIVPYVRGLIVIPLLVMADNVIEPMMSRTLGYLQSSGIVPDSERQKLDSAADKMSRKMNSKFIQLILVILVVVVSWLLWSDYNFMWIDKGVTSWMLYIDDGIVDVGYAGTWFLLVTSPLVLFLLYRWLWRFLIWSIFLYRVSRIKLELYASHTDLAGGLGPIGGGQSLFVILFFIIASLLSSDLAGNLLYEGDELVQVKQVVVFFIIISVALILMPLLFFVKKLFVLKRKAIVEYGALQHRASCDFHNHWIKNKANDLVDSVQPSALADYGAVYEGISNMRMIPISTKTIAVLAIVLLVPFLPLTLTQSSFWDVLKMIGGSLL
jgi:hypothetical protein